MPGRGDGAGRPGQRTAYGRRSNTAQGYVRDHGVSAGIADMTKQMRVVSLVPSLTEAVASVDASLLVGATDYCVWPPDLDVQRVGGSKYPNVERVIELRPDLVLT